MIPCSNYTAGEMPRFWKIHGDELQSYIRKHLKDNELAKDLAQEIFLKVFTYCQRYEWSCEKAGVKNLRSWLFQMAHNTMIDHLRRQNRFVEMQEETLSPATHSSNAYAFAMHYLPPILSCLPKLYAEPLHLSDVEGYPQHKVAELLGLSLSATKSRIQRARVMLRELLYECAYIETDQKGRMISFDIKPDCQSVNEYLQKNTAEVASF